MFNQSTIAQLGISLLLALPLAAVAEVPPVQQAADALVEEALQANLELAAADAGTAQRLAALDAARARFLPSLDLQLRYSRADGGREIEVPAANLRFRFLREREQDSVLRLSQPLYDARLGAARDAASHALDAARHGESALRNRVVRDMRQAYYAWLATRESLAILGAAATLAVENERVNDSLYRNGKVTRDLVLRAEADRLEVEQALLRAAAQERLARQYVNLLRNAPLAADLEAAAASPADLAQQSRSLAGRLGGSLASEALESRAITRRPDLRQLDAGIAVSAAGERAAESAFRPQLLLAVDAGSQGPEWDYRESDAYVLASVVLRFNLFNGGGDRARLRESRAQGRELQARRELAEQQVRLEVQRALSDFAVAEASLRTAQRRAAAAEDAFAIVAKKRDLGQVPPAEFLDARRSLTEARLGVNVSYFEALGALAELEYASGAETLQ